MSVTMCQLEKEICLRNILKIGQFNTFARETNEDSRIEHRLEQEGFLSEAPMHPNQASSECTSREKVAGTQRNQEY